MRLYRLRKKSAILLSRAQRGICFFTNTRKKADSSGKPRPRNDSFGVFPQPLQPRRKLGDINAALQAAGLLEIEIQHRLFRQSGLSSARRAVNHSGEIG